MGFEDSHAVGAMISRRDRGREVFRTRNKRPIHLIDDAVTAHPKGSNRGTKGGGQIIPTRGESIGGSTEDSATTTKTVLEGESRRLVTGAFKRAVQLTRVNSDCPEPAPATRPTKFS